MCGRWKLSRSLLPSRPSSDRTSRMVSTGLLSLIATIFTVFFVMTWVLGKLSRPSALSQVTIICELKSLPRVNRRLRKLPSLIVCPPSLSGHWQQEIKQYAPFLNCVAYVGPPAERSRLQALFANADIVVTSYDVCRNDNDVLNLSTGTTVCLTRVILSRTQGQDHTSVKQLPATTVSSCPVRLSRTMCSSCGRSSTS